VQELIRGYTAEKAQLEAMRQQKIRELEEAKAMAERIREEKAQEIDVRFFFCPFSSFFLFF